MRPPARRAAGRADRTSRTGCADLRKHMAWYFKGFPVGGELRRRLAMVSSLGRARSTCSTSSTRTCPSRRPSSGRPAAGRVRRGARSRCPRAGSTTRPGATSIWSAPSWASPVADQPRSPPRAQAWAQTMAGHPDGGLVRAHADVAAAVGPGPLVDRELREERERRDAPAGRHPRRRRRAPERAGGARRRAHLLRAGPRPDRALHRLPPAGRQDPGRGLPDRPPAHPADPCPGGRPGRHLDRPRRRGQRHAGRRHRARATTAATGPAGTPARTRSTPFIPRGYDHGPWGADVVLRRLNLCAETLGRDPQPLLVPAGARHRRG